MRMAPVFEKRPRRRPLKTAKEMAEELGVSVRVVAGFLGRPGAPKPRLDYQPSSRGFRVCWYDPREFRQWWASIQP